MQPHHTSSMYPPSGVLPFHHHHHHHIHHHHFNAPSAAGVLGRGGHESSTLASFRNPVVPDPRTYRAPNVLPTFSQVPQLMTNGADMGMHIGANHLSRFNPNAETRIQPPHLSSNLTPSRTTPWECSSKAAVVSNPWENATAPTPPRPCYPSQTFASSAVLPTRDVAPRLSNSGTPNSKLARTEQSFGQAYVDSLCFIVLHPMDIDTSSERIVRDWWQRSGHTREATTVQQLPDLVYYHSKGVNLIIASLQFAVNGYPVCAVGKSRKKKQADMLCYMHAAQLIQYYENFQQQTHGLPPALQADDDAGKATFVNASAPQATNQVPLSGGFDALRAVPVSSNMLRGSALAESDGFSESERLAYYARYEIPPSPSPIVNEATARIRRESNSIDPHSLHKLNLCIPDASAQMKSVQVMSKVHLVNFVIDREANLIATGVATAAKQAKHRCAAHALHILTLYKEQQKINALNNSFTPTGATTVSSGTVFPSPGSLSNAAAPSSSIEALLGSLPKRSQLLFRYLQRLFHMNPSRTFQMHPDEPQRPVVCALELGGVKCTGAGINCFDAERLAMDNAITELEMCDERVAALRSFISEHPLLDPDSMPNAVLPNMLQQRIQMLANLESKVFPEEHSHCFAEEQCEADVSGPVKEDEQVVNAVSFARPRNTVRAERMRQELSARLTDPVYLRDFHPRRSTLPMAKKKKLVLDTVQQHRVTIIAGTTGCGKTTQVPQYLFDDAIERGEGDMCNILVTQSRRLSTFNVANRIASERLSEVGQDIGYAVRFDSVMGRHVNICTSGVLLQILTVHPHLDHVTHLILDEVHDRDVNCDMTLALVKNLLEFNQHIRVILMSATIEAELFSAYFGGAPIIQVNGAVYPVTVLHLEDIQAMLQNSSPRGSSHGPGNFEQEMEVAALEAIASHARLEKQSPTTSYRRVRNPPSPPKVIDYDLIATLVYRSVRTHLTSSNASKSILVFLPGWKELTSAKQAIERFNPPPGTPQCHIILLHSAIESAEQRTCFLPPPHNHFKVVLATNIAESGITIDDVAVVIDTGLIKETSWSEHRSRRDEQQQQQQERHMASLFGEPGQSNFSSSGGSNGSHVMSTQLKLKYASRANCTQRTGRAGRTQGGVCYRLFTRQVESMLDDFPTAEIHRLPLSQVLLKCLALHHPPSTFLTEFVEPPAKKHVQLSMRQLQHLGAVTDDEKLTPLGMYLSRLPCEPRMGKLIVMGTVLQCLDSVLTVAAATDVSPFRFNRLLVHEIKKQRYILSRGSQSDQITSLNAFNAFCANGGDVAFADHNHLSIRQLHMISLYKQQYRDILFRSGFLSTETKRLSRRSSLSSFSAEMGEEMFSSEGTTGNGGNATGFFIDEGPDSKYSMDISLVKACIASCLFPNIAVLDVANRSSNKQKIILRASNIPAVTPANNSVCRRVGLPPDPPQKKKKGEQPPFTSSPPPSVASRVPSLFYVYQDVFQMEQIKKNFLREVSSISLWALILFCGSTDAFMSYNEHLGVGVIENWIPIMMNKSTYIAVSELRRVMDRCMLRKYRNPFNQKNNHLLDTVREICQQVLRTPSDNHSCNDNMENKLMYKENTAPPITILGDFGSIVPPNRSYAAQKSEEFFSPLDGNVAFSDAEADEENDENGSALYQDEVEF